MKHGSIGEDVKELKMLLNIVGDFGLDESNPNFLDATTYAVKAYQKRKGLTVDGVAGVKTMAALRKDTEDVIGKPIQSKSEEGTLEWYAEQYERMTFDNDKLSEINSAGKRVLAGKARYAPVAKAILTTDEAWDVIGALHNMEASCNFAGVLHNGERIIGTGKKTSLVPAGRGPFETWEAAAIDAMTLNGSRWAEVKKNPRSIAHILYAAERFNGSGYLTGAGKADTSPYIWACTSVNDNTGKYIADGKYSATANSNNQVGVAAIFKWLELNGHIKLGKNSAPSIPVVIAQPGGGANGDEAWGKELDKLMGLHESDPKLQKVVVPFWPKVGLPSYKTLVGNMYAHCGVGIFCVLMLGGYEPLKNGAAAAVNWLKYGQSINWQVDGIPKNAILQINHKNQKNCGNSGSNHVGLAFGSCAASDLVEMIKVKKIDKDGKTYDGWVPNLKPGMTIDIKGMNQGNMVKRSTYALTELCGVRWPSKTLLGALVEKPPKVMKSVNCTSGSRGIESTR